MHYLRALTSPHRTHLSNRHLGRSLAFVAGAVNAGGFFAVGQYTSHMSGIVSSLADGAALGDVPVLLHRATPANDGGLALGQAVIAAAQALHGAESN